MEEKSYSKRPIWQWVVIYLIVGGIIYAAVWYFFLGGNGGGSYSVPSTPQIPGY